ncbi:MAG: hypothetical protein ACOYN0_11955 [Phycisphaerales bacterium]
MSTLSSSEAAASWRVVSATVGAASSAFSPRAVKGAAADALQVALDAQAQAAIAAQIRIGPALDELMKLRFAGETLTDCIQDALAACGKLMSKYPSKSPLSVSLYSNVMEYRDTGSGGHETRARVVVTRGEESQELTVQSPTDPDRQLDVVVRFKFAPVSAAGGGAAAGA